MTQKQSRLIIFFKFFFISSSISNEVATDSRRSSEDMPSVAVSTCTTSSQITYNSTSTMVLNKESLNMLPAMSPISEFSFDYPEETITHGLPIFYYETNFFLKKKVFFFTKKK